MYPPKPTYKIPLIVNEAVIQVKLQLRRNCSETKKSSPRPIERRIQWQFPAACLYMLQNIVICLNRSWVCKKPNTETKSLDELWPNHATLSNRPRWTLSCKMCPIICILGRCFRALSAFFYFVALDKSGRPIKVPVLNPHSEEEKQRFEEGKGRYEARKQRKQRGN